MTVRKYAVSYWTMQISNLICLAAAFWFLAELYPFSSDSMPLSLLIGGCCVIMAALLLLNPWKDRLVIDAEGIKCLRRGRELWFLPREEIGLICPRTVNRCRGYVIVPKTVPAWNGQSAGPVSDHTFERSPRITAALRLYGYDRLMGS